MEAINLPAAPVKSQNDRFWARQFGAQITTPQICFDVALGIVGPVLCFIFDPIVFRRGFEGPPLFPEYQTFTYLFSAIKVAALSIWLIFRPRNEFSSSTIGGVLFGGAFFCLTT